MVFMVFTPRYVEQSVLSVKPNILSVTCTLWKSYTFTGFREPGDKASMCSLPLPTKPKFADDDTARYESKKGEKARDVPLNPVVRYFMPNIVEITCLRTACEGAYWARKK